MPVSSLAFIAWLFGTTVEDSIDEKATPAKRSAVLAQAAR